MRENNCDEVIQEGTDSKLTIYIYFHPKDFSGEITAKAFDKQNAKWGEWN